MAQQIVFLSHAQHQTTTNTREMPLEISGIREFWANWSGFLVFWSFGFPILWFSVSQFLSFLIFFETFGCHLCRRCHARCILLITLSQTDSISVFWVTCRQTNDMEYIHLFASKIPLPDFWTKNKISNIQMENMTFLLLRLLFATRYFFDKYLKHIFEFKKF